jgi:FtsP/CotA-like multicopper oxidase with cupredoxin domain
VPNGSALTILTVRSARKDTSDFRLPERLSTYDESWQPGEAANQRPRRFAITISQMRWLLNDRAFEMEGASSDETVRMGSKEIWEFANVNSMMRMAHPIHLHGRQFRVLRRTIDPATAAIWETLREGFVDEGWKDTVLVMPGEQVQILSHFQRYPGLFLYHCHNLEHEDMGMMRNYRIRA